MKRVGNLYDKIVDRENIRLAIRKSSLGKRDKWYVQNVLSREEETIDAIRAMLSAQTFRASPYEQKKILDGAGKKERIISKPRYFPDQIVHWALMLQIQPIIMRGMYEYNCGSIPGRGSSFGAKAVRRWMDTDRRNTKYCLKLDISKFYPSMRGDVLKAMFRRIIKCRRTLWLIDTIIDSADGLPIGNFTSQWFANFALQGLDHHIKEKLGAKYYVRYVDDLVIMGPNKRELHKMRHGIAGCLAKIGLMLKRNWQVFRVDDRGIDFLGIRFFRDRTILRKRVALRMRRRAKRISRKRHLSAKDASAVISYWGWIKRTNSFRFYHKHIKPHVSIEHARRAVGAYARQDARRRERNGQAVHLRPNPGI